MHGDKRIRSKIMWVGVGCIALALLAAAILVPVKVTSIRKARELTLRQDLFTIRAVLDQYIADKGQRPQSLTTLWLPGI